MLELIELYWIQPILWFLLILAGLWFLQLLLEGTKQREAAFMATQRDDTDQLDAGAAVLDGPVGGECQWPAQGSRRGGDGQWRPHAQPLFDGGAGMRLNEKIIQFEQTVYRNDVLHFALTSLGRIFVGIYEPDEDGQPALRWKELEQPPLLRERE